MPCSMRSARRSPFCWLASLAFTLVLAGGCATSESGSRPSRPGAGLVEYRSIVAELQKAVAASRQSAQALAAATQNKSVAAYEHFSETVQRLEAGSIKARSRADAMEKRGQAYFEEWAEEITGSTDGASNETARERFAQLHQHFEKILDDSRQVRQVFRRFLDGLRGVNASLGEHPSPSAVEVVKPALNKVDSDGREVENSLQHLLATLDKAHNAMRSGALPGAKSGGKQ